MRRWRGIVLYSLGAIIFLSVGLEICLRLTFADPDYYWDYRFQFVSPRAFQNRADGIWTYRPNTLIREVAVYATFKPFQSEPRFVVEYDCQMKANNLGLLQDNDINPGDEVTLIVGDSFTAGQGGCPWFPRLAARRSGELIVNAGQIGTGFAQWQRMLDYLVNQQLKIRRLLVVAISDDFNRPTWNWSEPVLACIDNNICNGADKPGWWLPVQSSDSETDLKLQAARRFSQRIGNLTEYAAMRRYLRQQFYLVKFGSRATRRLMELVNLRKSSSVTFMTANNASALESFKRLGIPFRVLLVPRRDETGLLSVNSTDAAAGAALVSLDIPHNWCPLATNDFFANDGHPNRSGYDKLVACVDLELGRM